MMHKGTIRFQTLLLKPTSHFIMGKSAIGPETTAISISALGWYGTFKSTTGVIIKTVSFPPKLAEFLGFKLRMASFNMVI